MFLPEDAYLTSETTVFNERLRLEFASSIPFFQLVCSYRTIDEIIAFTHLKGNTNKCNL